MKELGSGQDDQVFEMAVETIRTSRTYLEELLQTLQADSPYYPCTISCMNAGRDSPCPI